MRRVPESGIDAGGSLEAPEEEPRADEQEEGERHLQDHQSLVHAGPSGPAGSLALHRRNGVRASRLEGRYEAEHQAGGQGHAEGVQEHGSVHAQGEGPGSVHGWPHGAQETDRDLRQAESGEPGDHAEEDTLHEELLDDSPPPGAEAQADPHLPPALPRPGQEEVGHVDAGDEEEERHDHHHDRAHPHLCGTERGVDARLPLRDQGGPHLGLVVVGVLLPELGQHRVENLSGVLHRLTVAEAAHGGHHVVAPGVDEVVAGLDDRLLHEGHVDGDAGEGHRALEARRGHAHHLEGLAVQHQGTAHHRRIGAEARLPESVAEDDHGVGPGVTVLHPGGEALPRAGVTP